MKANTIQKIGQKRLQGAIRRFVSNPRIEIVRVVAGSCGAGYYLTAETAGGEYEDFSFNGQSPASYMRTLTTLHAYVFGLTPEDDDFKRLQGLGGTTTIS